MRAGILLIALSPLVMGCEVDRDSRTTGGALPSGEPIPVRVCRAATSAFNPSEPTGERTVESATAEAVRISYEGAPGAAGLAVECSLTATEVTWRPVDVMGQDGQIPFERPPGKASYVVEGNVVRLVQQRADGGRTETQWSSFEVSAGSMNSNAPSGAQ